MTTTESTSVSATSSERHSCRARFGGLVSLCLVLCVSIAVRAEEVYLQPEAFLREAFDGDVPEPRALWLSGDLKEEVKSILGHRYAALRLRYWLSDGRSAWILDEIGKELPITTGVVVGPEGIEQVRVLIYRESRGYEVRYPAFTRQFEGATLADDDTLDRRIDAITGATLSVRALTNLSRLALFLHRHVSGANGA